MGASMTGSLGLTAKRHLITGRAPIHLQLNPRRSNTPESWSTFIDARLGPLNMLRFSCSQVYATVIDFESYPQFIPFFSDCRVVDGPVEAEDEDWRQGNPDGQVMTISSSVGFKLFQDTYMSTVRAMPTSSITVHLHLP